jgi:alpha-amylase
VVAAIAALLVGCSSSVSPGPSGPAGGSSSSNGLPGGSDGGASAALGGAPTCPPIPPLDPPPELGQPGWWRDRTFYEAFVRSFADGTGDGVGDLAGLTARLDYLNDGDPSTTTDLGVTGLWLMPTFPSPSYHGYDVTDYRGVNPAYGSLDDLKRLVAEAHRRGIGVLLDLPLNHTSAKHPWFVASRTGLGGKADWYVWSDTPQGNGWQPADGRYYYAAFGPDLPDLNLRNLAVTAEVTGDAEFWLDDVGVDGFRLDAAKYLIEDGPTTENTPETHEWWKSFRAAVDAKAPGALLLGEVYDMPQNSASYVPDDLDMTFDFALASSTVTAAQSGGDSVERVLEKITTLYPAVGGFGSFLTNHDQDRIASQLHGDADGLRIAADLLLTGPGVPFVYYGEEIGITGAKPDERIRAPMRWDASAPAAGFSTHTPWEALSDDPPPVNVAAESADPASLLSRYRDLVRLRAQHPALALGTWTPVKTDAPNVVAALRASPTEVALVLNNVGKEPATPTLALASGPLCGASTATVAWGGGTASSPAVSATGGFDRYRPVGSIPGRSSVVIVFGR